jgi:monofunctional biosynthetic peptidoglycan transglycosylase
MTGSIHFSGLEMKALMARVPEVRWQRPEETRLDGELSFSREGRRLSLSGALVLRELALAWEPLAPAPVAADVRLEGEAHWEERSLSVSRGRLQARGAEIEWEGLLRLPPDEDFSADVRARLRETSCQEVIDAIPEGMLGEYAGFVLEGTMSGNVRLQFRPRKPEEGRLEIEVDDDCRFREVPASATLGRLRGRFEHRVSSGEGRTLSFATGPSSPSWTSLSRISPNLLQAVLAQEDGTFFEHHGFSPEAFGMAFERNLEEGRFASGASTISMQLARNLFLGRDKTLARKLQEIVLTWWLEKRLTKHEILELYLNVIEFGPSIYGVGAASRHYFGRAPDSLSPAEAAFLASVLPAPSRYHRAYERGELTENGQARVERVLRLMKVRGHIDEAALADGLEEVRRGLRFHYGPGPAPPSQDFGPAPSGERRP